MTLTKQTVFLPQKENGNYSIHWNKDMIFNHAIMKEGYFFSPEKLNEYTADVIRQALDTAAKEAEPNILNKRAKNPKFTIVDVDKKSITNTFEEVFQKYKV